MSTATASGGHCPQARTIERNASLLGTENRGPDRTADQTEPQTTVRPEKRRNQHSTAAAGQASKQQAELRPTPCRRSRRRTAASCRLVCPVLCGVCLSRSVCVFVFCDVGAGVLCPCVVCFLRLCVASRSAMCQAQDKRACVALIRDANRPSTSTTTGGLCLCLFVFVSVQRRLLLPRFQKTARGPVSAMYRRGVLRCTQARLCFDVAGAVCASM